MTFHAVLELGGRTATGIPVPPKVVDALGAGRRPPVRVTLRGHVFRTTLGAVDGRAMVPVSAQVREAAGVAAGDALDVVLELDTAPREVAVPDDLAALLAERPAARAFFDGLSPSRRGAWAGWVEAAKRPETRQRRLEETVSALEAGRAQR